MIYLKKKLANQSCLCIKNFIIVHVSQILLYSSIWILAQNLNMHMLPMQNWCWKHAQCSIFLRASYFYKHFYTPTCTWTLRTKISSFSYKVQLRFVSKFCSLIIKIFSMNVQCKVAIHTFYLLTKEGCIKSYQFLERCIH